MGEIVAKHVEIDEVLGGYAAFDFFFKDKAWDKIYRCLVSLSGAGATKAVFSLATKELDASVRVATYHATYEQKAGLRLGIDDVMPVEADALEGMPADNGANQTARNEAVKSNEEIADAAFLRCVRFKELSVSGCGLQGYGRLWGCARGSARTSRPLRGTPHIICGWCACCGARCSPRNQQTQCSARCRQGCAVSTSSRPSTGSAGRLDVSRLRQERRECGMTNDSPIFVGECVTREGGKEMEIVTTCWIRRCAL